MSYAKSVEYPPPPVQVHLPESDKMLLIFDMDETLIHCLPSGGDTGSTTETDVVLKIPDYKGKYEEDSLL